MSLWSKIVVAAVVLAIVVPMMIMIGLRMIRGQPFRDSGKSSTLPPSGPGIDIGGP